MMSLSNIPSLHSHSPYVFSVVYRSVVGIAIVLLLVPLTHGRIVNTFARYKLILDREPFGEAADEEQTSSATAAPIIQTGPCFIDALKMCAVTRSGPELRVGFIDVRAKPLKTYYLYEGETEDGITVVSADYEEESAILRKDGLERKLLMQSLNSHRDNSGPPSLSAASHSGGPPGVTDAGRPPGSSGGVRLSAARVRRMELREARRIASLAKSEEDQSEEARAARAQALRNYNLDVIRSGAPGLPIPLTEEEDALLVSEGVLAPLPAP